MITWGLNMTKHHPFVTACNGLPQNDWLLVSLDTQGSPFFLRTTLDGHQHEEPSTWAEGQHMALKKDLHFGSMKHELEHTVSVHRPYSRAPNTF